MADNDLIRRGDALALPYRLSPSLDASDGYYVSVDAIRALPAAQVAVKPLEWRDDGTNGHETDHAFGFYEVYPSPEGDMLSRDGVDSGVFPTIEAAKAAAQADYDARIRSALTIDPAKVQALVEAVPTTAAERDVLSERSRQCVVEGWDTEHDDIHTEGELAKVAACYAWMAAQSDGLRSAFDRPPPTWPAEWDEYWWKPTTPRRDLVKAAALIIAEIERLDRAALAAMKEG